MSSLKDRNMEAGIRCSGITFCEVGQRCKNYLRIGPVRSCLLMEPLDQSLGSVRNGTKQASKAGGGLSSLQMVDYNCYVGEGVLVTFLRGPTKLHSGR